MLIPGLICVIYIAAFIKFYIDAGKEIDERIRKPGRG